MVCCGSYLFPSLAWRNQQSFNRSATDETLNQKSECPWYSLTSKNCLRLIMIQLEVQLLKNKLEVWTKSQNLKVENPHHIYTAEQVILISTVYISFYTREGMKSWQLYSAKRHHRHSDGQVQTLRTVSERSGLTHSFGLCQTTTPTTTERVCLIA